MFQSPPANGDPTGTILVVEADPVPRPMGGNGDARMPGGMGHAT